MASIESQVPGITCSAPTATCERRHARGAPVWKPSQRVGSQPMRGLALTFDDGPHELCTPALLDLLAFHGARATFFLVGPQATTHPEIVAQILGRGHTVGLHCDAHI